MNVGLWLVGALMVSCAVFVAVWGVWWVFIERPLMLKIERVRRRKAQIKTRRYYVNRY